MVDRRRLDDMSAEIDEAAARWHLAQIDDDMDWAAFTDWLKADPRHREAFDAMTLLDARIDAARPVLTRILTVPIAPRRRALPRWSVWGAVAATLVLAVLVTLYRGSKPGEAIVMAYVTAPGEVRTVGLPGGSSAILAPGSRLRVPASRDQALMLDGKAFFAIRHDAAHPLTVVAGGYSIQDVGTRFDIATGGDMVQVAVAEGEVAVRAPDRSGSVAVTAGRALTVGSGIRQPRLQVIEPGAVGGWRTGPLVYDAVPVGLVVADIARTSGRAVTVAPSMADRRFSGVIGHGDARAMSSALAALTGLSVEMDGDAIRLVDRTVR